MFMFSVDFNVFFWGGFLVSGLSSDVFLLQVQILDQVDMIFQRLPVDHGFP